MMEPKPMADDDVPTMDYDEHQSTYVLFVTLTKWAVILTLLIVALMGIFLV